MYSVDYRFRKQNHEIDRGIYLNNVKRRKSLTNKHIPRG